MNFAKGILLFTTLGVLVAACDKQNLGVDLFVDSKDLSQLKSGIWIDPNGCDHWIIDDGAEGYLSARSDKYGKPICSGSAPPNTVIGPYNSGGFRWDPI